MKDRSTSAQSAIVDWETVRPGQIDMKPGIDLWRWHASEQPGRFEWLSTDERQRADRMAPVLSRRFVANRSAVRYLLSPYLGIPPQAIEFKYSDLGRPTVSGHGNSLDFNLSHSGDLAILAISSNHRVGVDLEYRRTLSDPMRVARRTFPSKWIKELENLDGQDLHYRFFQYWTRYEAGRKTVGSGVFSPQPRAGDNRVEFQPDPDCFACLCWLGDSGDEDSNWPAIRFLALQSP